MLVLSLFTCVVLGAFSAQAKVVRSFDECKEFFYKDTEPSGMDQNAKRICQKWRNNTGFYYATLYSVPHRIPLYSAYKFDPKCSTATGRTRIWCIEPQISNDSSNIDYMVPEREINVDNVEAIKQFQAMSSHYTNTGYDRGHLYPNSFQCNEGRNATFTLTNVVPMNRNFNQFHWNKCESTLKSFLIAKLASDGGLATVYIVTGAVPAGNVRIPQMEISEDKKVTVPSHIWTAVCYKHLYDDEKSFSFGYIGKNQEAEPDIRIMSVSQLNDRLSKLYRRLSKSDKLIRVFVDDCFGDNTKLNSVYRNLTEVSGAQQYKTDHPHAIYRIDYYWYGKNEDKTGKNRKKIAKKRKYCPSKDQNNCDKICISEDFSVFQRKNAGQISAVATMGKNICGAIRIIKKTINIVAQSVLGRFCHQELIPSVYLKAVGVFTGKVLCN